MSLYNYCKENKLEYVEDHIRIHDEYELIKCGNYEFKIHNFYDELPKDDEAFIVTYSRDFYNPSNIISKENIKEYYQGTYKDKNYHIFPLGALIHGSIWLQLESTSFICDPGGWDSVWIGVVCVSRTLAKTRNKARKIAADLVETWNTYLNEGYYCIEYPDGGSNIVLGKDSVEEDIINYIKSKSS